MSPPVLFVLGAGPKIGLSVAYAFSIKGYKVALAARSLEDGFSTEGYLHVRLDLSNTADIEVAFGKVKKSLGIPSVVVYNGASRVELDTNDPFKALSVPDVQIDFAVNAISTLFAAKSAVEGFKGLPPSFPKTYIFTGNKLNVMAWPHVVSFGMGKNASAYAMWCGSIAYGGKGYRFYYVDERQEDGSPMIPVSGEAAAEMYVQLAEANEQRPWHHTFVQGKGYVEFKEE